jgi:hypothetical protein
MQHTCEASASLRRGGGRARSCQLLSMLAGPAAGTPGARPAGPGAPRPAGDAGARAQATAPRCSTCWSSSWAAFRLPCRPCSA